MSIDVDWGRNPISIKSSNKEDLVNLLAFLKEKGLKKHSIIMSDRVSGGFLFFVYGKLDKNVINKWKLEGE